MFVGDFKPKEELKYKVSEGGDPNTSEDKIAVEVGTRDEDDTAVVPPTAQGPEDIDVCLVLSGLDPACSGRFRIVLEELPGKFNFTDVAPDDGIPDSLIFTLNGVPIAPTVQEVLGTESLVGPTLTGAGVLDLHWELLNVEPGEKVEVEPYMLFNCDTIGQYAYQFELGIKPIGKSDPFPLDNVAAGLSHVVIEAP